MMKRAFTRREKVLLLVLVVILLLTGYLKLFLEPVEKQYAAAQTRCGNVQSALTREQAKLADMKKMEAALKKQEGGGVSGITIPAYDNSDNVMVQLDKILGSAVNYQMTFSDVVYGENLVSRPLKLTFSAGSYAAAREILTDLYSCKYRCALSDITVSSGSDDGNLRSGGVHVSLTATFYEKLDRAAKQDQAAAKQAAERKPAAAD